jgi:hypothetical protein
MTDKRRIPHYLFLPAMIAFLMLFFAGCGEQDESDWPSGYENVISLHTDALIEFEEGTFELENYSTDEYSELQSEYMTYGFLESLIPDLSSAGDYYYGFMDLDGDDNDELIIMQKINDDEFTYHGIYSLDGGEPYMILETGLWDRCRAFVYSDGTIEVFGSSGAADYTSEFYKFDDGELELVETVGSDDGDKYDKVTEKYRSLGAPDIEWISFIK